MTLHRITSHFGGVFGREEIKIAKFPQRPRKNRGAIRTCVFQCFAAEFGPLLLILLDMSKIQPFHSEKVVQTRNSTRRSARSCLTCRCRRSCKLTLRISSSRCWQDNQEFGRNIGHRVEIESFGSAARSFVFLYVQGDYQER